MKCSECKWWGRNLVGANHTQPNKKAAICDDPDSPSNYYTISYSGPPSHRAINLWTYEDFSCKSFKLKEK